MAADLARLLGVTRIGNVLCETELPFENKRISVFRKLIEDTLFFMTRNPSSSFFHVALIVD